MSDAVAVSADVAIPLALIVNEPVAGITVNCIHPGTTRTERTPSLLAARATQLGVSPEDAERQDFAPDSPRGNAICRMVDASEIAFVAVFLASDKAWAVSGELVAATGGAGRTVFY
jgi:NAD(P)-dependent dehydrogenase (short-subunit alcohol dehydrogenase family)